jgi:hypothetical protein
MASIAALAFLAALVSLSFAIGAALLRRFSDWRSPLEKAVFAVPLGMGVVSYGLLALGLLRLFRPGVFGGVLALGVVALPFAGRDILALRRATRTQSWQSTTGIAAGLFLAAMAVCTIIAALAPSTDWDGLSYHLAAPKVYVTLGRILYLPYDHHTNLPFTLEMLYGLMLGVGSVGGAKLCHHLCGALLVAGVYTAARRHIGPVERGRKVGLIAAVLLAATPMFFWEMTVAYSDLATALYTFVGLYALLNAAEECRDARPYRGWLLLSAVLTGFAIGTKFTALAYWGLMLVGIAVSIFRKPSQRRFSLRDGALWGLGALLVASPWYVKTYLYTGNPVFPFAYNLFGGRYWDAANAAKYAGLQAQLGGDKSIISLLLSPWATTVLPSAIPFSEYYTFGLAPVYAAFLLAIPLLRLRLARAGGALLLFSLGAYAFWFFSVQQTRYLIPAFPALALVAAEVVVALEERFRFPARFAARALIAGTALWALFLGFGLAFFGVREFSGNHRVAWPAWPVVSGAESRDDYVGKALGGVAKAEFYINANTPSNAKVVLLDFERGFYLDRPYAWGAPEYAAGLFPYHSYPDASAWLADFKRRGYTTLLIGPRSPELPPDGARWRTLLEQAIAENRVELVYEAPALGAIPARVYRIP